MLIFRGYIFSEEPGFAMGVTVIIPEGGIGMYTNMEYGPKYYNYISRELPRYIRKVFNIDANPENTYIGGFSMGGNGALKSVSET